MSVNYFIASKKDSVNLYRFENVEDYSLAEWILRMEALNNHIESINMATAKNLVLNFDIEPIFVTV